MKTLTVRTRDLVLGTACLCSNVYAHLSHLGQETLRLGTILASPRACETA